MHSIRIRVVPGRKVDCPGEIAHVAIAAAIHQAANAPKEITQGNAWGQNIRPFPKRYLFQASIKK